MIYFFIGLIVGLTIVIIDYILWVDRDEVG